MKVLCVGGEKDGIFYNIVSQDINHVNFPVAPRLGESGGFREERYNVIKLNVSINNEFIFLVSDGLTVDDLIEKLTSNYVGDDSPYWRNRR